MTFTTDATHGSIAASAVGSFPRSDRWGRGNT